MRNYLERVAIRIYQKAENCEGTDEWGSREFDDRPLYRMYALLCLTTGEATEASAVHNAWVAYTTGYRPDHPDLVPFDRLSPTVQSFDDAYRDTIRAVAAEERVRLRP